jgi:hypothetical protein
LEGCIPDILQQNCPTVIDGNLGGNPDLTTNSWVNFCANGEGSCTVATQQPAFIENGILLFPNPSEDRVRIAWETQNRLFSSIFQLVDSQGRVLKRDLILGNTMELDIQSLPAGIYTLLVGNYSTRMIKQ